LFGSSALYTSKKCRISSLSKSVTSVMSFSRCHPRVGRGDAQDLVVGALLVSHPEHAMARHRIRQPGKVGSSRSTRAFQWVTVIGERVLDVAVIAG